MATTAVLRNRSGSISLNLLGGAGAAYNILAGGLDPQPAEHTVFVADSGPFRHGDEFHSSTLRNRKVEIRLVNQAATDDALMKVINDIDRLILMAELSYEQGIDEEVRFEYTPGAASKVNYFDVISGEYEVLRNTELGAETDRGRFVSEVIITLLCKPFIRGEETGVFSNLGRNTHGHRVRLDTGAIVGYSLSNSTAVQDFKDKETGRNSILIRATGGSGTNNNIQQVITWPAGNAYRGRVFTLIVRYKWNPVSATQGFVNLSDGVASESTDFVSSGTPSADTGVWRTAIVSRLVDATATSLTARFDARTANSATSGADILRIDRWALFERPLMALDNFTGTNGDKLEDRICAIAGERWSVNNDGWTITSNLVTYGGAAGEVASVIETFRSDVILEGTYRTPSAGTTLGGFAFRFQNSENHIFLMMQDDGAAGNDTFVYRRVNNTNTLIAQANASLAVGTTYTVRILLQGTSIKVLIDGVSIIDTTSSQFQTATSHGLYRYDAATTARWGAFKIRDYAPDATSQQNFSIMDTWVDGKELKNRLDLLDNPSQDPEYLNYIEMLTTGYEADWRAYILEDQAKTDVFIGIRRGSQMFDGLFIEAEKYNPAATGFGANYALDTTVNGANSPSGPATNNVISITNSGYTGDAAGAAVYVSWTIPWMPPGEYVVLFRVDSENLVAAVYAYAAGSSILGTVQAPSVAGDYVSISAVTSRMYACPQTILVPNPSRHFNEHHGNMELRLYQRGSGQAVGEVIGIDWLFLCPADLFAAHASAIAAGQYTVIDRLSKNGNIGVMTADYQMTTEPSNPQGRIPPIIRAGLRMYVWGNRSASDMVHADTREISFRVTPRFREMRD